MSMKAILVIDMPKSCADCKLSDFGRCWGTYSYVHMRSDDIPVNCPLKPMPERQKVKAGAGGYTRGFTAGYNKLRYLIVGAYEEIEK